MSDRNLDGAARIKVITVDDEPDILDVVTRFIEALDCDVTMCASGEAALAELEKNPHDIVVSDIRMRGMDGVELLRRVKEKWPGIEFIIVSGNATVETAISALRLGAYDILLKPVRMEQLQATVRRARERLLFARENRELREVVDRLEELNSRKEKFVAIANHELRTPTTVAAGLVSMIKKRAAKTSPELLELAERADAAMARLKDVVREIGELAGARSPETWVKPYPVRLALIADEVGKIARDHAENRALELEVDCAAPQGVELNADPFKLARAVGALVQNAVRHTPDGKKVAVTITCSDGLAAFTVSDEGVGVAPGEEEKIFDLFYVSGSELAHHTSESEFGGEGMGIGLALARLVARAHGGDVTYAPNPGGGAEFKLTVKAA